MSTPLLDWQRDILTAAEERGWAVTSIDVHGVVVLEEPYSRGNVVRIQGREITPEFVRALPEARGPRE